MSIKKPSKSFQTTANASAEFQYQISNKEGNIFYKLNALILISLFIFVFKYSPVKKKKCTIKCTLLKIYNLHVTVTSSYNGGGGIIGALTVSTIDSSRQSSAAEKAQPIIKELDGYNFRKGFFNSNKRQNK